jgi:uncharacterized protein (TIGR02145 family)
LLLNFEYKNINIIKILTKMKKKRSFLVLSSLLFGLCLCFVMGCDKENEDPKEKEKGKIPGLTTTEISEISETTAVSGGNISTDNGEAVTKRGVCWSTNQNPTIQNDKTEDGSGVGSFTSSISDLEPNTTYYVRAYATNSVGTAYGNAISFKTKGGGGSEGSFTDSRDGNVYKTVTIGSQVWMAENLRYIPSVIGPDSTSSTMPYYYVGDYNGTSVSEAKATTCYATYGVLYNWTAACSSCPSGWHLPTEDEWAELVEYVGGISVAGGKLKETGTTHWGNPNEGATNEVGFTALPGGYLYGYGMFQNIGYDSYFWTVTEKSDLSAMSYYMKHNVSNVSKANGYKTRGYSVRCVKD